MSNDKRKSKGKLDIVTNFGNICICSVESKYIYVSERRIINFVIFLSELESFFFFLNIKRKNHKRNNYHVFSFFIK